MPHPHSSVHGYDKDFYAWAMYNAGMIRQGNLSQIDLENVAEEIESMGRSNKRELVSRLAVLFAHLLKWRFQSERRSRDAKYCVSTIEEQRFELKDLLKESPSLKHEIEDQISHAYLKALLIAIKETGLSRETFPKECPFSLKQALNENFFPKS